MHRLVYIPFEHSFLSDVFSSLSRPRYGHEHAAPDLQKEAVYGLTELFRDKVKAGRLIANPGCYPTCSQVRVA